MATQFCVHGGLQNKEAGPKKYCSPNVGLETHDPKIKSLMLYQLTYRNILTQNSVKNNQYPKQNPVLNFHAKI